MKPMLGVAILVFGLGVAAWGGGSNGTPAPGSPGNPPKAKAAGPATASDDDLRLEGEKRFRTNCGRCHQAPHKFPPRMMATIIRHMRVRSMITEEDMKLILRYMTQ